MAFNIGSCPGAAGAGAKFPQYTVISSNIEGGTTGVVGKVDNATAKALVEATAFPSRVYFFTSQTAAQNCINASGGAVSPPLQKIASAGQSVTNAATGGTSSGKCCLITMPIVNTCILSRTECRALVGGLLGAVSLITGIIGLLLLVVEGFEHTGAGQAAGGALETTGAALAFVPGLEGVGVGVAGARGRHPSVSSGARSSRSHAVRSGRPASRSARQPQDKARNDDPTRPPPAARPPGRARRPAVPGPPRPTATGTGTRPPPTPAALASSARPTDPQPCAGCGDGGTVQLDDQAPAVAPCDGCADRQARLFFWIGAAFGTALCGLAVGIWAWTVARRLARPPGTGQETGPDD